MNNKKEGNIKSTKLNSLWNRIGKKVSAGVVGLGLVVGTVFGFVGCTNNPTPTPPGPGPTPPPIVVVDGIKFDEFIAEHLEDAKGFINEFVRPEVIEDKDLVSESLFMEPNADNDKVQEVGMIYTYRESANRTIIEYVKVSFDAENLITFNKIVDGEVVKSDIKFAKSIVYQKAINPIIQEENDTFTDQLCDKLFGVNYDATRYIIEGSESLDADLGQVKLFTVIEITDSAIKENTIKLCIA